MKTIYKYVINDTAVVAGIQNGKTLLLPVGSKILCCKLQNNKDICVWVELDPKVEEKEEFTFVLFGTGWPMADLADANYEYVDTIMFDDGVFVYHVYRIK